MRQTGVSAQTRGSKEAEPPVDTTVARQSIRDTSRRQQVVDLLRNEIITGQLSPGDQLKQDVLCRDFSVSPAPVREALRQLENDGLVTHYPNRGVYVSEITSEDLLGILLPVRLAIETYAMVKSAALLKAGVAAQLEELVAGMEKGAKARDLNTINELDMRFHEVTVEASGSAQALQLWRSVEPRIRTQIYRLAPRHKKLSDIAAEHRQLLQALTSGDPQLLRAELTEHIIGSAEKLVHASKR